MAAQIWLALLLTTFRMLPKMDRRSTLPVPMDGILAPAEGENEVRMDRSEWKFWKWDVQNIFGVDRSEWRFWD